MIFLVAFSILTQSACLELDEIRKLYFKGNSENAYAALECRLQLNPQDRESLRLRSDFRWWDLETPASLEDAEKAQRLALQAPLDAEMDTRMTHRMARNKAYLTYEGLWDQRNRFAQDMKLAWSFRALEQNFVNFSWQRSGRVLGEEARHDTLWAIVYSGRLSSRVSLGAMAQYAHDPIFSPRIKYALEPRWDPMPALGFILRAQSSIYKDTTGWQVKPQIEWKPFDPLTLDIFSDIALKPDRAISGGFFLGTVSPLSWSAKWGLSGGKTDDGEGLVVSFFSVSAEIGYSFTKYLEAHLTCSQYQADNRDEFRLGSYLSLTF